MRVAVTGSEGFIGQNLLPALAGHEVVAIPDLGTIQGPCDAVIHLGAISGVEACDAHPEDACRVNITWTTALIESVRRFSPGARFLFASSQAVYAKPLTLYGATKAAGESLLEGYRTRGIRSVVMQLGSVYGPHSEHKSSVVAQFIRQAMAGEPLTITGDGRQTRRFIYVEDVARQIVSCLDTPFERLSIMGEQSISINEVAALVNEAFGGDLVIRHSDGSQHVTSEPSRGYVEDGSLTAFDVGLAKTIAWFRTQAESRLIPT